MISYVSRVRDLLSTSDGQRQFIEWLSLPLTQELLAAGRELARPRRPSGDNGETTDFTLGRSLGAFEILDFLASPVCTREEDAGLPKLTPSYGSEEILAKQAAGEFDPAR